MVCTTPFREEHKQALTRVEREVGGGGGGSGCCHGGAGNACCWPVLVGVSNEMGVLGVSDAASW